MYCNFSLTLQVKCPHPRMLLSKQMSLSKWQNASRVYLCQPGSWRCLLLHLWSYEEQPLAHDVSRQQMQAIKVAAVLHPLQPLGHPQLLQKDHRVNKMKALLCSLVLGLLVASQADAQIDASQVPGAFDRGLCLGGSLGVYPCACPFQGPVVWIAKSSHLSAVQNCSIHWLYTCCLWRLYHLCHLFTGSHACSLLLLNWRNITQLLD